nr:FAD-dependent oxidoreductase [Coralloluteibacterium stylophorae]
MDALPEHHGTRVRIGDTEVLLLRRGDAVFAYQADCPHAGAPLEGGAVCAGRLVCPWHKAQFRIEDGGLCEPAALDGLRRYDVEVRDGLVHLDPTPRAAATVHARRGGDARRFAIVGGGTAGTAAAAALREFGFAGRIVIVERERAAPYDRTVLSKFVPAGAMAPDDVPPIREHAWFAAHDIERIEAEVVAVDAAAREIALADGRRIDYDAALLATGATPVNLDLPGAHLSGVHTLRSRDDAAALLRDAAPGRRAVVIGDSFIGMECASALTERGLGVTVVGRHPLPFARQFGEEVAAAIKGLHGAHGVRFLTGAEPVAFEGCGRVERVCLADGGEALADLVVVGIGVRPATALLRGVALAEDGGVPVDAGLCAAPGLYAAGDIARFPLPGHGALRIEHWRLAEQHGRLAARNMLDPERPRAYEAVPFFWTQHFGKRYDYLGHARNWDGVEIHGDLAEHRFVALLHRDGAVVAAVGCQRERVTAALVRAMRDRLDLATARHLIAHYG